MECVRVSPQELLPRRDVPQGLEVKTREVRGRPARQKPQQHVRPVVIVVDQPAEVRWVIPGGVHAGGGGGWRGVLISQSRHYF